MVKKMVGSNPALIGQKLPVSYRGSIEENYLELAVRTLHSAFGLEEEAGNGNGA